MIFLITCSDTSVEQRLILTHSRQLQSVADSVAKLRNDVGLVALVGSGNMFINSDRQSCKQVLVCGEQH